MPYTVNGFGTHVCSGRGDVGWNSCDSMEWFVAAFMPVIPLKAAHTFDWHGINYRQVPIRWSFDLVMRTFFGRWLWGIGCIGALFVLFAVLDKHGNTPLFAILAGLCLAMAVIMGVVLRLTDERNKNIRRLLGTWPLGTCDPANLLPDLLHDIAGDPRTKYGTETFAEAVHKCLQRGEYSSAMWAARLSTGLENRAEGEQLTDEVLHDEGVRSALASVKQDVNTWQQVMLSEDERRQSAAQQQGPMDALPADDDRIQAREPQRPRRLGDDDEGRFQRRD